TRSISALACSFVQIILNVPRQLPTSQLRNSQRTSNSQPPNCTLGGCFECWNLGVDRELRSWALAIDHFAVLRMLTFLKRATGHPWLTELLCTGCPLPSLNAPPSWYVAGPPSMSSDFQNSGVFD